MISLPLSVPDGRVSTLFPTANSSAFKYDNSYIDEDTVNHGTGYWLKFNAPDTITIIGTKIKEDTIHLQTGWNMIDAPAVTSLVTDGYTEPADILNSSFFEYSNSPSYTACDTLRPGKGYWVKCNQPGKLIFSHSLKPELISPTNNSTDQPVAIELRWHSLTGYSRYQLQVSADSSFSYLMYVDDTLEVDTIQQLVNLNYNENIYWHVRGIADDSVSGWSKRWMFRTILLPPLGPTDPYALFASVDGGPTGLWVFDPNTLMPIDSLVMDGPVPFSIEVSPDASTWYMIFQTDTIYAYDAQTKKIKDKVNTHGWEITSDRDKRFLITNNDKITEIWDRRTLSIVHIDSPVTIISFFCIASPVENKMYTGGNYIEEYDLDSFHIIKRFPVIDSSRRGIIFTDIGISPDGKYLYFTVFNYVSWWGYGSFFVVDLVGDSLIAEYNCGSFAKIAVSPDGMCVYLTDPGAWLGVPESWPTYQVLRYNVLANSMDVFIDWRDYPSLTGVSRSDHIAISPDGGLMHLIVSGSGFTKLINIQIPSKAIVATKSLSMPEIRRLKIEKYLR